MDGFNIEISERKKLILEAVVNEHVATGEPVGSKLLAKYMPYSSATIRNEMAELEALGYLEYPYESAGRVPTKKGYRYFVDSLMSSYRMTVGESQELNRLSKMKLTEIDKIIDSAASLAGAITNYTTLTFKGKPGGAVITNFKVMKMSAHRFLLIMVTSADVAKTKHITVDFEVTSGMLKRLEFVLNRHLAGKNIEEITVPVILQMEEIMGEDGKQLISPIIKIVYEITNELGGDLNFDGVNRLLQYPEYNDLEKLRGVLGALEHKSDLIDIVSQSPKDEVNVFIGQENRVETMSDSTLVFRTITRGDKVVGAIGVIGPCRMDYAKVVTTVDMLSRNIQQMLSGGELPEGRNTEGDNK